MAFHPPMLYLGYVGLHRPLHVRHGGAGHRAVRRGLARRHAPRRRSSRGASSPSASSSAPGGATRSSAGVATGRGTRSRTRRCSRGSLRPRSSTRSSCRSAAGCCACGTCRSSIATFCLTILGTFLTRSGVINSVHTFTESDIGPWLLGFLARRRGGGHRADRLARRRAARPGSDRLPGLARVGVPRQQPALCRAGVRRAARHRLPAARRSAPGPAAERRRAVLRPHDDADRPRAALHHGGRAGAALARDERARCCAIACSSRRGWAGVTMVIARLARCARSHGRRRVRARGLRARGDRAPVRRRHHARSTGQRDEGWARSVVADGARRTRGCTADSSCTRASCSSRSRSLRRARTRRSERCASPVASRRRSPATGDLPRDERVTSDRSETCRQGPCTDRARRATTSGSTRRRSTSSRAPRPRSARRRCGPGSSATCTSRSSPRPPGRVRGGSRSVSRSTRWSCGSGSEVA